MEKSIFKHNPPGGTIETAGRVYADSPVGPGSFHKLKQADYGQGFRQATLREVLDLAHQSYFNQGITGADKVVQASRKFYLSGNTAILYVPNMVIVQDMPQVENGRIVMDEKSLTSKLSKNAKNGVRFSNDETIRALPYSFETGWQDAKQIEANPFTIALTGDIEAGKKLAQIQGQIGKRGYIWALGKGTDNQIRVPDLSEYVSSLGLNGYDWFDLDVNGHSFGVRQ
ncbi:MAG: hypothetical protein AABW71_00725 [Nanoarchaeota archaeon]